jgi:hypothetical protein
VWGRSHAGHLVNQAAATSKNFGGINLANVKGRLQSILLHPVIRMLSSKPGSAWVGTLFRPLNALCLENFDLGLLQDDNWVQLLGCFDALTSITAVLKRPISGLRPVREALILWAQRGPFQNPAANHHFTLRETPDPRPSFWSALHANLPSRPLAMHCIRGHRKDTSFETSDNICFPTVAKILATNACKLAHNIDGQSAAVPISSISVSDIYWSQQIEVLPSAALRWYEALVDFDHATASEAEVAMPFHQGAKCYLLPSLHFTDFNRNLALLHLNFGLVNEWTKTWQLRQAGGIPGVTGLCHLFSRIQISPPTGEATKFRLSECPLCHTDVPAEKATMAIHAFSECGAWASPLWAWLFNQLQQQLEDKNLEKFQPGVIFLGVNLNKDIDYPTVFAMAVLKSALFTVVATAAEGMSTAKFSLVGIKQIVEAKVRQEGYIQWLSLMKHRVGNISANPLRIEANRMKFSKRWCKSPFPMILQDDTHFQWVPWAS